MHNFNVAEAKSMVKVHTQLMSLEKNLSADMYHYPVSLRDMDDAGLTIVPTFVAGGITAGGAQLPPYWELGEVTDDVGVQFYVPRHPRWLYGQLYITVHYTVDKKDGNISWGFAGVSMADGDALPTVTFANVPIAAPAAVDELDVQDITLSSSTDFHVLVTTEHVGTIMVLSRRPADADDTATGNVRLHKVVVNYVEAKREIGDKF